jgi:hypothetical protein
MAVLGRTAMLAAEKDLQHQYITEYSQCSQSIQLGDMSAQDFEILGCGERNSVPFATTTIAFRNPVKIHRYCLSGINYAIAVNVKESQIPLPLPGSLLAVVSEVFLRCNEQAESLRSQLRSKRSKLGFGRGITQLDVDSVRLD